MGLGTCERLKVFFWWSSLLSNFSTRESTRRLGHKNHEYLVGVGLVLFASMDPET